MHLQEKAASCGLACVKMVIETVKRESFSEGWYRTLARGSYGWLDSGAYTPGVGCGMPRMAELIQSGGVQAALKDSQTIADLMAATENGYPAIAAMGDAGGGHAVVVDGFLQDAAGSRYVVARDPWNLGLLDMKSRWSFEQLGFKNYAVYSVQDFLDRGGFGTVG